MAILKGDWNTAEDWLKRNSNDVRTKILLMGLNALQVAVLAGKLNIVEELVKLMKVEDLEMTSNYGNTAFTFAALNGRIDMMKIMLEKNQNLVTKGNDFDGCLPIVTASLYGQGETIHYLLKRTPIQLLSPRSGDKNGATPLNSLIRNGFYVPKSIKDMKMRHAQALQLLKLLFKEIPTLTNEELNNLRFTHIMYDAINCGIVEFIQELITSNPELVWRVDTKRRALFAYAILLRQEKIFSLIYGLGAKSRTIVTKREMFANNSYTLLLSYLLTFNLIEFLVQLCKCKRNYNGKVNVIFPASF
ncbi:uncharacterized protein LOC131172106 [Hevea brasiliensis]|uniref:uncharacterized protein LOC131172106 n=1 Tax=Hevea brasiliensis TaxID=3981 RepID=UPI0025F0E109|nr:uncharacterized protein LOC131172106 [Hevea brasiliensis]